MKTFYELNKINEYKDGLEMKIGTNDFKRINDRLLHLQQVYIDLQKELKKKDKTLFDVKDFCYRYYNLNLEQFDMYKLLEKIIEIIERG